MRCHQNTHVGWTILVPVCLLVENGAAGNFFSATSLGKTMLDALVDNFCASQPLLFRLSDQSQARLATFSLASANPLLALNHTESVMGQPL